MKRARKFLTTLVMAALLLVVGARSALADDGYTFVVKNDTTTGYEYKLYEMLKGDIATVDGKQVLSNVQWGSSVPAETQEIMYNMAGLTGTNRTAEEFAKWLGNQDSTVFHQMITQVGANDGSSLTSPQTLTYSATDYVIDGSPVAGYGKTGLSGGYYLVRNTAVPTGETYSDYIVFVLSEDTVATPKSAPSPTAEKKVTDKNDTYPSTAEINATGDSADYDIGDSVPYTLRRL